MIPISKSKIRILKKIEDIISIQCKDIILESVHFLQIMPRRFD